jgi:hypothetical protein
MERTLKANFCFALVCKLVVEVQKEYFSFHLHGFATWREHKRESLVWFSSQRVCGGPTKFYSLHLHGSATCTKLRGFFLCFKILLTIFMNSLFAFHVILFFFVLLSLLCAMERQERYMLSANRKCLLDGDL